MLATFFQYVSLAVLTGVACALCLEIVRIGRRLMADRRADRIRIRQLIEEVELRQREARRTAVEEVAATASQVPLQPSEVSRQGKSSDESKPTAPPPAWKGTRPFRIVQKITECDGCQSIYLMPVDGAPLPLYLPGQFLTFNAKIPGQAKQTVRCYSLSDEPNQEFYRCTIKRLGRDPQRSDSVPGLMSSHLHDGVKSGDILEVGAPRGSFFLDLFSERPVVLVAAGIGITPLLSMLNTLLHTGFSNSIYLFFGVRSGAEHPFRKHLSKLALQHDQLTILTAYSQPQPQDQWSRDYQIHGRIDVDVVKQTVKTTHAEFYICGPGRFMQDMVEGLTQWGVGEEHIRYEAFGPSTVAVKRAAMPSPGHAQNGSPQSAGCNVEFARSGVTVAWSNDSESLLEFAEKNGIEIEAGCRSGNCGTCATGVKSGSVDYHDHADPACEEDHCLPCVCTPAESLILDA